MAAVKPVVAVPLAAVAILAALALGAALGETSIPLGTVARTAANQLFGAGFAVDPIDAGIIWNYRLARAAVAACCGVGSVHRTDPDIR